MRNHGYFCTKTFVIRERLTLDKGVSLAKSVEIAEKGAKDLKSHLWRTMQNFTSSLAELCQEVRISPGKISTSILLVVSDVVAGI